jgi:hypothetical protein
MVSRVANMEIRQFWMEQFTEVPSPSFRIAQVLHIKKNEN